MDGTADLASELATHDARRSGMTPTEIKIGLLWHSANSGNLGVGALTIANMAVVRGVAHAMGLEPRFTIIGMGEKKGDSYVPAADASQFVVNTRSVLDPRECFAVMRAQDCVLDIGGGDSFTDIYASRRYAFIWATKALAIAAGRPLLLSPQTVGPFSRQPHTAAAVWAMRHAEAIVVRDEPSAAEVKRLAPRARCVLATDVAFALPYADRSKERGGLRPRVGINVSGLLFNEALSGRNKFGLDLDYAALTHQLMEDFRSRGAEVHLFTHANAHEPSDDDAGVVDEVAAQYPWAIRVPDFPGPSEAKSFISSLDFMTSGRMHACIGAVSSGTPAVPIAYSRKFRGVFGLVDYPWMIDVAGKSTEDARAFILDSYDRRGELASACRRSMEKVDSLLDGYRVELRRLFEKISNT
jgi:colanic acid/amylovoran biosynthesis protein